MTNVLVMCKWMVVWQVFAGVFQPNWSDLRFPKSTPCAQTPGCPTRVSSPMPTNWNARTLTSTSSVKSTWCTPKPRFDFLWLWCMCGWLWKSCTVRRTAVVGESCVELEMVAVVFHYVVYALQCKCLSSGTWARQRSPFFRPRSRLLFAFDHKVSFRLQCKRFGFRFGYYLSSLSGWAVHPKGFERCFRFHNFVILCEWYPKKGLLKWK